MNWEFHMQTLCSSIGIFADDLAISLDYELDYGCTDNTSA